MAMRETEKRWTVQLQEYVDYIDTITNSNSGVGMDSKSIRVETTPDRNTLDDTTAVGMDDKKIN